MAEKQWYFKFDPQSLEFIPGAIFADEQPDNTTNVEPTGLMNPKWNASTNSWTGQSVNDYLAEQKTSQKTNVNSVQQQLSTIANQFLQQNIALTKRVAELEAKEAK